MIPEIELVKRWGRLQRFAASMNLHLSVSDERAGFRIGEGSDDTGKEVAAGLPSLQSVQRILSMYHRIETRYMQGESV